MKWLWALLLALVLTGCGGPMVLPQSGSDVVTDTTTLEPVPGVPPGTNSDAPDGEASNDTVLEEAATEQPSRTLLRFGTVKTASFDLNKGDNIDVSGRWFVVLDRREYKTYVQLDDGAQVWVFNSAVDQATTE